jgi:hypothetical protein
MPFLDTATDNNNNNRRSHNQRPQPQLRLRTIHQLRQGWVYPDEATTIKLLLLLPPPPPLLTACLEPTMVDGDSPNTSPNKPTPFNNRRSRNTRSNTRSNSNSSTTTTRGIIAVIPHRKPMPPLVRLLLSFTIRRNSRLWEDDDDDDADDRSSRHVRYNNNALL